jgi:hypothetical protein
MDILLLKVTKFSLCRSYIDTLRGVFSIFTRPSLLTYFVFSFLFYFALTTQRPSIRKSRHYVAVSGGRSVGIVRLRTKATEFFLFYYKQTDMTKIIN